MACCYVDVDMAEYAAYIVRVINAWVALPTKAALEFTVRGDRRFQTPFRNVLDPAHARLPNLLASCINSCPRDGAIQERLCALVSCIPKGTRICTVIAVDCVRSVMMLGWQKVYSALCSRARGDIMHCMAACVTCAGPEIGPCTDVTRVVIKSVLHLEVVDIAILQEAALRVLAHFPDCRTVNMLYDLFGATFLHRNSVFEKRVLIVLRAFPAVRDFARSCDEYQCHMHLTYARVDLSPDVGSRWLRELCQRDARDYEELDLNLSVSDALQSRLNYFSRAKNYKTKRKVVLAVVDGVNLFHFALRVRATYSDLGVMLSDFLFNMAVEFPALLEPVVHAKTFRDALGYGFHSLYYVSIRSLSKRVNELLVKFNPRRASALEHVTAELKLINESGLQKDTICAKLSRSALKTTDIVIWRRLLRACLAF